MNSVIVHCFHPDQSGTLLVLVGLSNTCNMLQNGYVTDIVLQGDEDLSDVPYQDLHL